MVKSQQDTKREQQNESFQSSSMSHDNSQDEDMFGVVLSGRDKNTKILLNSRQSVKLNTDCTPRILGQVPNKLTLSHRRQTNSNKIERKMTMMGMEA